jgi:hypothetical protein
MDKFNSGDTFQIPCSSEYAGDFFIVTRTRPFMDSYILDAVCDGAEDIQISINAKDVIKVDV